MNDLPRYALGLAVLSCLAVALSGPGSSLGWWHFRTGFMILRWGGYAGLVAAAVALAGMLRGGVDKWGLAALGLGLLACAIPWSWYRLARAVPMIHDITTDTDNPPSFAAILALRKGAANSADYGGPGVAAQQKAAYPDIKTLALNEPPAQAFERALAAAKRLGWEIAAADASKGRIEAVDTTRWFRFKDDIVIRVLPKGGESKLDVRSVSRVGKSDIGANAKRIRKFLAAL